MQPGDIVPQHDAEVRRVVEDRGPGTRLVLHSLKRPSREQHEERWHGRDAVAHVERARDGETQREHAERGREPADEQQREAAVRAASEQHEAGQHRQRPGRGERRRHRRGMKPEQRPAEVRDRAVERHAGRRDGPDAGQAAGAVQLRCEQDPERRELVRDGQRVQPPRSEERPQGGAGLAALKQCQQEHQLGRGHDEDTGPVRPHGQRGGDGMKRPVDGAAVPDGPGGTQHRERAEQRDQLVAGRVLAEPDDDRRDGRQQRRHDRRAAVEELARQPRGDSDQQHAGDQRREPDREVAVSGHTDDAPLDHRLQRRLHATMGEAREQPVERQVGLVEEPDLLG
jgi:hypothetical protein